MGTGEEADAGSGQPRDREPGVLAPAAGSVSAAMRNSTAPRSRPSEEDWLITAAWARWPRNGTRLNTLSLQAGQQVIPEAAVLHGDRLGHGDRWDEERVRRLGPDPCEFAGQDFGQAGCRLAPSASQPLDDVDTIFADRGCRPPTGARFPRAAACLGQVGLDNGAALARIVNMVSWAARAAGALAACRGLCADRCR